MPDTHMCFDAKNPNDATALQICIGVKLQGHWVMTDAVCLWIWNWMDKAKTSQKQAEKIKTQAKTSWKQVKISRKLV